MNSIKEDRRCSLIISSLNVSTKRRENFMSQYKNPHHRQTTPYTLLEKYKEMVNHTGRGSNTKEDYGNHGYLKQCPNGNLIVSSSNTTLKVTGFGEDLRSGVLYVIW